MAKGYWIAHVTIDDAEAYRAYQEANAAPLAAFGARFLVRAGTCEGVEGAIRPRHVVIEFPSYADALACYASPEYQAAKALRDPVSRADIVIVEGV
jgi:uncharacterized protein (DUF1330 family)